MSKKRGVEVTGIALMWASKDKNRTGLLAWITATFNHVLVVDGIALRRTLEGRLTLSYPSKTDKKGKQHFYVRPLDDVSRRDIEQQVFRSMGYEQEEDAVKVVR